jgi:Pectate lyase superfamily protein
MAKRITQLSALTVPPARDDLFVMVDDPAGSAVTKKIAYSLIVPEFNVESFGAVGDGVTDDSVAIQAAIDAAEAVGGAVYFPAPDTYIAEGLRVEASKVAIRGNRATLKLKASATLDLLTIDDVPQHIRISGMTFDGNRTNQVGARNLVVFEAWSGGARTADRCLIDDCQFLDALGSGLRIENGRIEIRTRDSSVRNCAVYGIYITGTDNVVDNCAVGLCDVGIYVDDFANRFINCNIYSCVTAGLRVTNGGRHSQIIGCEFDSNDSYDLVLQGTAGGTLDTIVSGCLFRSKSTVNADGTYPFIYIDNARAITIDGCLSSITSGKFDASYAIEIGSTVSDIVLGSNWWEPLSYATGETNDRSKFRSGFFGKSPVLLQSAATDIKDALTNYGLLQGTSPSPLYLDGGVLTAFSVAFSDNVGANNDILLSRGGTNRLDLADGDTLRIASDGTASLQFGASGDVLLKWGAADVLETNDAFRFERAAGTDSAIISRVTGDAVSRSVINVNGRWEMGDGTGTRDFGMGRTVANRLDFDSGDSLYLTSGNITLAGSGNTIDFSHSGGGLLEASDTTTGLKVLSAATKKLGFYGATPVVRPAAYTQTYSTADRTLDAYTSDSEGSAYTGINNLQGGTPYAQVADLNTLRVAYENLRVFTENAVQVLNSLLDDQQSLGLVG